MEKEINMDEICSGCLSHERVGEPVSSIKGGILYGECPGYIGKEIDCPCQHCLIKGMCDDVCEDVKKTNWFRNVK